MENVNNRIFRLLGTEHGAQKRLADYLGISDRNINMWKTRGSAIDSEFVPAIADYFGVTDSYVLRGHDEKLSEDEMQLLNLYHALGESEKKWILKYIEFTLQQKIETEMNDVRKEEDEKNIG